jgi:hypothetical protein
VRQRGGYRHTRLAELLLVPSGVLSHRGKRLREVPGPFVVALPSEARVRTRLAVNDNDEMVLEALGAHLGRLASLDLAHRVAEGPLDAKGKPSRAEPASRP